jgi:ribonucleoside-diphosphate reductase alpha chain
MMEKDTYDAGEHPLSTREALWKAVERIERDKAAGKIDAPHRRLLPERRAHWIIAFECAGQRYVGGYGRFPDGSLAEVFIDGSKIGADAASNAQDAAVVASLAFQHGCPPETVKRALARAGGSAGPLVTLLSLIPDEQHCG